MFAHAGVHLDGAAAAACVEELRRRIRSPALEYKANHLLREKNRKALEWFLGTGGPIHGHAHVYLVDKTLLLLARVVEVVGGGPADAVTAYRHIRSSTQPQDWSVFLVALNDLLRPRTRPTGPPTPPVIAPGCGDAPPVLARLRAAGPLIEAMRAGHQAVPQLDPLLPAIARAVAVWGDDGRTPVSVVHDRQTSLTPERVATFLAVPGAPAGLRFVASRTDPRVQVADFLAGVARRVRSEELGGRLDPGLIALLAQYTDTESIWDADPRR